MKKVKEFITKHYVVLIPICLIVILLLTYAIYSIQKLYNSYSETYQEEGYTHFAGTKITDKFSVKVNRKQEIIDLTTTKDMDLTNMIYIDNKVIFPKEMTALFIYDNYKQVRVPIYTSVEYDEANTAYKLKTIDYEQEVSNFILFDGYDLYFFPEASILDIDGERINLSPMSYAIVNNNNSLEYYDKETDKYTIKNITNEKIYVSNNAYKISLNEDKAIRFDKFVMLNKPNDLPNIK